MKKHLIPFISLASVLLFAFSGRSNQTFSTKPAGNDSMVVFSAQVRAIIDNKCYGCHSNESKGAKARKKLNWDSLNLLTRAQKANKLDDVVEVVSEDEMPPKKFLEKEPMKKLTPEEKKVLENWADSEMNRISRASKKK